MRILIRIVVGVALALQCSATTVHAAAPDFTLWQDLLNRYARQVSAKGQSIDTRFDYEQLYVDENIWGTRESAKLARIREQMFAIPPESMGVADRRAWAINAYNFLVVERATFKLLVPGRRFLRYGSVNEMLYSDGPFFEAKAVTIGEQAYTIAEFERAYIQNDPIMPPEPRSRPSDPRVAFATCPGAVGGPTLWLRAFRGDSIEAQLDRVTRNALANPKWIRVGADKNNLEVSDALFTRRFDLGGDAAGIIRFVAKYGPKDAQGVIRKYKLTAPPRYMAFDWKLNQVERPKNLIPQGALSDSLAKR
ncbi:MAG: DUF547 domain-containing protein [Candidatus Eisenbacteria bacterium]